MNSLNDKTIDNGKLSKDVIIHNLKKANEILSSKTFELESKFVKQYDVLASELHKQKEEINKKSNENKLLNDKLKEGSDIIAALEKEKQLQKKQIVDLTSDLESTHSHRSDEITLHKERTREAELKVQELEKERDSLVRQVDQVCMDRDSVKAKFIQYKKQMQAYDGSNNQPSIEISMSPQSENCDTSEVRQTWMQLDEKKKQLESTLLLLHETQSSFTTIEQKYKALQKQFDEKVESETKDVQAKFEKEIDELKSASRSKDESVASLNEQLARYNDDLTKAEDEVDRLNKQIDEANLNRLKEQYEETKRLLEEEKEYTSELTEKNEDLVATIQTMEKESSEQKDHTVDHIVREKEKKIQDLQHEVDVYRKKIAEEEKQTKILLNMKVSRIKELEDAMKEAAIKPEIRMEKLEAENRSLKQELESMEKELQHVIQDQTDLERKLQDKLDKHDDEKSSPKRLGPVDVAMSRLNSIIAEKDAEIAELKKEIDQRANDMTALEESHKEGKTVLKLKSQIMSKEREIKQLQMDIANQKSRPEQKELDVVEDDTKHQKEISEVEKKLNNEIMELKNKLSDRDTTIAATLKSSVLQEQKINNLKEEVKVLQERKGDLTENMQNLQNNPALGTDQSQTKLERQIEEYKTKVRERDGAIQSLVKSSITQEQQITALREEVTDLKHTKPHHESQDANDPSWRELERLKQESEIFAGQIIEQDEEIEDLRRLLDEAYVKANENDNLKKMINDLREQLEINEAGDNVERIKVELDDERKKRLELELEVQKFKDNKRDTRLSRIQKELEEVEESNQNLQDEIRDLRRKLRSSQLEAERIEDLESELENTKKNLKDLRKKHLSSNDEDLKTIRKQRDALDAEMRQLKLKVKEIEEKCQKLEETLVVCRTEKDTMLKEFKSKEAVLNQEKMILLGEKNATTKLREKIEARLKSSENNEIKLKGQIESQKTLREIAISDKDKEISSYQSRMSILQQNLDDQNALVDSLATEVKRLRSTQMHKSDTESTEIIAALTEEVKRLRSNHMKQSNEDSSAIIAALTEEVKKLRSYQSHNDSNDVISALSEEVKTLHAALKEKSKGNVDTSEIERVIRNEIDQELQSIKKQKDFLGKENAKLEEKINALESGEEVKLLKKQVDEAEKARTDFEKTMISTYERKLNLMQMNKDLTIDGLRKDLAQSKETLKEIESDLLDKIRSLESDKHELESELKAKMQHKNSKIQFLEQTLSAHEQVVRHMQDEMDQLQSGMEDVSVNRRAEQEELQEELMTVQSKATKYQREIAALKMTIDDMQIQHNNEIERLHHDMEEMQLDNDENPTIRQLAEKEKMVVNQLSKQVENLKEKVRSLQEENFDLRDKMERNDPRASKNDKWRNSALQEQVHVLTKRIRELEGNGETSSKISSSRKSGRRTLPPSPRGSVVSNKSLGGGDDVSTYTEATM